MGAKLLFVACSGAFFSAMGISAMGQEMKGAVKVFMCGDVMTGRGIDQVLPRGQGKP